MTGGWENFNFISNVSELFANYGWYILIATIILIYIYQNFLKAKLQEYKKAKDEAEYYAKYHKNSDLLVSRLTAQQTAVEKLQEKYKRDAELFKEKEEEKQRKKNEEKLKNFEHKGGGFRLNAQSSTSSDNNDSKNTKSFRPEYNPLMGGGSSSNYRPPRRNPCGGDGCGR